MAFFEELGRKAKDVAAVAADKAKDVAAVAADKARETTEKTKISVAIAGEQREIEKNCRLIGEWFINEYEGELPRVFRNWRMPLPLPRPASRSWRSRRTPSRWSTVKYLRRSRA